MAGTHMIRGGEFTLDLNGNKITQPSGTAISITGGSVTITDTGSGGTIEASTDAIYVEGGDLFITYDVSVGENTNILSYDDAFDVAEWAIPAMHWACGSGMIRGVANDGKMNLEPQGNATRAQAAAILQRFCENVASKE